MARLTTFFILLLFTGCTIDDEDRCLKGYTWDPDILSCRKDLDTDTLTDSDTGTETTSDFDAGPNPDGGSSTDSEEDTATGDDLPSGLGEMCTANGNECAAFEANFCLYNPIKPEEPGVCTIKDCQGDDCPTGYQCCDVILNIACLPDESVEEAIAGGATCPPE